MLCFTIIFILSCHRITTNKKLIPISEKSLNDSTSIFYTDFDSYKTLSLDTLPIGIYSSDLEGFYLLDKLLLADNVNNISGENKPDQIRDFAGENVQLVVDMANSPYNYYLTENNKDYLRELIVKNVLFLLGDKYYIRSSDKVPYGIKNRCKIIILGSGFTEYLSSRDINDLLSQSNSGVKFVGVVESTMKSIFQPFEEQHVKDSISVGVLTTSELSTHDVYGNSIRSYQKSLPYKTFIKILTQNCSGLSEALSGNINFVDSTIHTPRESYMGPAIGEGDLDIKLSLLNLYNFDFSNNHILFAKNDDKYTVLQLNSPENYVRFYLVNLFEQLRKSKEQVPLTSIVLAGAQYPLFIDLLNQVVKEISEYQKNGRRIYSHLISPYFKFVDPFMCCANECYNILREDDLLALRTSRGKIDYFKSVPNFTVDTENLNDRGDLSYKFKYLRPHGLEDETTVFVFSTKDNTKGAEFEFIKTNVPFVFNKLTNKFNNE